VIPLLRCKNKLRNLSMKMSRKRLRIQYEVEEKVGH
jgi:hypothetical protein